jgi:molecular chaperone HtpG
MDDKKPERFQVDLRGLIDLLSQHLYSGPSIFVRELLQNAVDAIRARQELEPDFAGSVQIELIESRDGRPTLLFQDDGIGLTEQEMHRFLATIGQSSKRPGSVERPEDFLGQFGIGLLSCFMVTDEIVVLSQSMRPGGHAPVEWRGSSDGTYEVRTLQQAIPVGTQVFLRAKKGVEEFFDKARLLSLARDFGGCLPFTICFTSAGQTHRVNTMAPWEETAADAISRHRLLDYGKNLFGREFVDAVPLRSSAGSVEGVAYVLADEVHAGANQVHRVYLKGMLLSAKTHDIVPEWAFFVQCVVNARSLRPTASREALYEDAALDEARQELGQCIREYLVGLARCEPQRFEHLIAVHQLALKAIALDDDECLELFADWFRFETSLGPMTFGEFRRQHPVVRYCATVDQFRQIAQVAASEAIAVINAGYVYDVDILQRIGAIRGDVQIERLEAEHLSERFEELNLDEREEMVPFVRLADATLQRYKCDVELARFRPKELPTLYVTNTNANFLRTVEQSREVADELWSGLLANLTEDISSAFARLYLNYNNPLVSKISRLADRQAQRRCLEMLYVQALLLGHFPLRRDEIKLLNQGLLGLIDWALDAREGERRE